MSHTPGPWTFQRASNYVGFSIAPKGTLPTLAAVERPRGNPQTCVVDCFNFPGETEANARLIAAAPELLDMLQRVRDACHIAQEDWDLADEVNAIIAKATGQEVSL